MDYKIAGDTQRFMVLWVASNFLKVTGRLSLYIFKNLSKNILVEEVRSLVLIKADRREAILYWALDLT